MVKLRPLTLEKPVDVGAEVVVVLLEVVFEVDEVVDEVVREVVVINVEEVVVVAVPRFLERR